MKKLLLLVLLLPGALFAQGSIETDRPGHTETTATVLKSRFQMEMGFEHDQTESNASELLLPAILSKVGITNKIEVRLVTNFEYNKAGDSTASGLGPVTVGAKVKLWKQKKVLPQTSLIAQVQLPKVASGDLRAEHVAPQLQLLFQNTLTKDISLGYNIDARWDGLNINPEFEYTVSPSYKFSSKIKGFVEVFGFIIKEENFDNWVDGGFTYLITKDIQVDISGGYELTPHSHFHQYFETMGLSFRI